LGLTILAACGGEHNMGAEAVPAGSLAGKQQASGTAAYSTDLVYIAHGRQGRFSHGLSILTFPQGKPVLRIATAGFPTAVCSDASGNIWAVVGNPSRWTAYEYAHGGKTPIEKIGIPHPHLASGCAVDPTTGNLAIVVGFYCGSGQCAYVDIWAGARKGKPASYPIAFTPRACTYDDDGNLFVDGYIGSTVTFGLAELAKGANSFRNVTLNKTPYNYPGGMQWDGKYLALVDKPWIYRIKMSGQTGEVVGRVPIKKLFYLSPLVIRDGLVVATTSAHAVALWPYPAGGRLTKTLAQYQSDAPGLAISANR
jgi:hypothetical protein